MQTQSHFKNKPAALLRLPAVLARLGIGKTTLWDGVLAGRYPKPYKISPRCTVWKSTDIDALVAGLGTGVEQASISLVPNGQESSSITK